MTSKIEWLRSADGRPGYTINPVKGLCPTACSYCYARRLYKRFKWNTEIRFEPLDYIKYPAGSRVFIGSTIDLFGEWVKESWLDQIFEWCRRLPEVTFIFLTKQPQKLGKWSPFPDNCHIGVSVTDEGQYLVAYHTLAQIQAKVKFLSFEPLLKPVLVGAESLKHMGIGWLICGQQTPVKPATMPKIEWIREIVEATDKAGIPVFLKENLENLFCYPLPEWAEDKFLCTRLRQEFPKV